MTLARYADFDFSGPSAPGLPRADVDPADERFAPWDVIMHTEAVNAPGVFRVFCALTSEPDAEGRKALVESSIFVIDRAGQAVTRRINLHVKDFES